jgi:cyclophilin family peptidyl-prolyl cis-trans isomerase
MTVRTLCRAAFLLSPLFIAVVPALAQDQALPDGLYAEITTNRGTIICSLEYQKAPMTVESFVGLAEGTIAANGAAGKRFFDGLTFHRVEPGFVIQGGDPNGNGTGGPGYEFPNETRPDLKHDRAGTLSMANAGPDTNGSQFFITLAPTPTLDGHYNVFGYVVKGMDVANAIQKGDTMTRVRILRVGAAAKAFTVTQESFNALVAKARAKERAAALALIMKKWPRLITTKSGLMYEVLAKGTGEGSPSPGSTVSVKYTGMLLDGKVFDSTEARGSPAVLSVNKVIPGWSEALLSMKRGERRMLVIPPELAYGERGYPGIIPPNAFLVFDVQLIDF